MGTDNETKEKLLISAKAEFMEKGYNKASLRSICKNAGVTTGALYFFFKDKEDLFAALVEEPLNKLYLVMTMHYSEEIEIYKKEFGNEDFHDDLETAFQAIHYLFKYHDEFQLVLTKSQGSRFENCIDSFVEITQKHYRKLADIMCEQINVPRIDDYMIHWLSHTQIDTFVHMISHEISEDKAVEHMKLIIKYFVSGWFGMISP